MILPKFVAWTRFVLWHLWGAGALALGVRCLFVALEVTALGEGEGATEPTVPRTSRPLSPAVSEPPRSQPDINELKKLAEPGKNGSSTDPSLPPSSVRALFVNWGPPRSEVRVQGRVVGHTPFAGQYTCRDGDRLEVSVIPTVGPPLSKTLVCLSHQARIDSADVIVEGEASAPILPEPPRSN